MFKKLTSLGKINFTINILILLLVIITQPACEMLGIQDKYPLVKAVQNGDMVSAEELLRKKTTVNTAINTVTEDQTFALLQAALIGDLDMVKLLVDNGADVDLSNIFGRTALMAAAYRGNDEVVSYLIENDADLTLTNKKGFSALHFAVNEENEKSVQLLVNNGAPLNGLNQDGFSPLLLAVKRGNIGVVRILIENSADLDEVNPEGITALHLAATKANYDLVSMLIDKGADIYKKDDSQENILFITAGASYSAIMNNIYDRTEKLANDLTDEKSESEDSSELYSFFTVISFLESINPGHSMKSQEDKFFDVLSHSTLSIDIAEEKFTSIAEQVKADYLLLTKEFLEKGMDVNVTDKDSKSLILKICQHDSGISEIFKTKSIPLESGVENRFNMASDTVDDTFRELIHLLIDAGADVNLVDQNGQTALIYACENGHYDFAELLLNNGAEINKSNNDGWTPLIAAVSEEKLPISELLLANGANANATNAFGETALLKAVYRNNSSLVSLLLKNGADISIKNSRGDSPLSVAQKKGYLEIIEILELQQ